MKEYGLGPNNAIPNSLKGEDFIIGTKEYDSCITSSYILHRIVDIDASPK